MGGYNPQPIQAIQDAVMAIRDNLEKSQEVTKVLADRGVIEEALASIEKVLAEFRTDEK